MAILRAALGLAFIILVAWLVAERRARIPWRIVAWGIGGQVLLALLILRTEPGRETMQLAAAFVNRLVGMARPGAELVFGPLADPAAMAGTFGPARAFVFAFAGTGLVVIIFFAALMSVLYHLGVMQRVTWVVARMLSATFGVSGAEALAMAATVFVGQAESPLVVRPYLARMTRSELNCLMTGGFATLAGSVLAVYIGMVGKRWAPDLLAASIMSAPAALLIAKVMLPETGQPMTAGRVPFVVERQSNNLIEAAVTGTRDGLQLYLNVIAMLIAFLGLLALIDWPLGALGGWLGVPELSLAWLLGWLLAPLAWLMGIDGWHDARLFGSLLGLKIAANEFLAYERLIHLFPGSGEALVFQHERSAGMAIYALCGFANFGSIGIQLACIPPLAPERGAEIAQLALRAMIGGALATCMTATVAGAFL